MKRADALAKLDAAMDGRVEHMLSNLADGYAGTADDLAKAKQRAAESVDINIAAYEFLRDLFTRKFTD